ncbi:PaaX family transcriptional regulator [Glutamicibacter sp. MNS18]|uniref:PaaX family transcriptional regulator n=1 Tax=Glutamicibacter sp. MNS18 TaxID=2989817 RepID=UPI00223615D7|nr:PaaX family transcriptional regulator C-terminal domain-containing protein [Glutamicibacter sp. MNS18]MCW4465145.1 PaaX family transcriptional regulator [Glutamicibacter sp. MNS18]
MPSSTRSADEHVVDFPRPQKGGNTQHLLVTMLGEFWRHTEMWLPARAVKQLAADLDISQSAVAAALSRLTGRGVLEQSGGGRSSKYRFTPDALARLEAGFEQFSSFGDPTRHWDRKWTATAFTIPETSRDLRESFRSRLRWLGFAPLYGALWVSPHDRTADVVAACRGFGLDDYLVFRMNEDELHGRYPGEAWNLDQAPERYLDFIETYKPLLPQADQPGFTDVEAFRIRVQVMDLWRAFPWDDPDLPIEILPAQWPLAPAREIFVGLHTQLAKSAQAHLETVLGLLCPEAVPGITLDSL